ncbi:MAG: 5,6-dimethylbenzimidazole synthase [Novosphingobium pentaromativorans]|uniref:5,6-dimethylbenzimidazole synthase n=1 Tax=Novosphingobium pentaromativorans TaxID=205844 RepID=A0A2W5NQG3_9SPHN|nr:MAG: 5,6-dimethylbenzimidazole synthase [Novosphingobium pentaromativorans]
MAPQFGPEFQHELAELLAWRRDVRHFRRDPLGEELVAELLEAAQLAPSVGNSQPWRFVRVRSPDLREKLAGHADSEIARAGASMPADRRAAYAALKLHGMREAPEVIAVFCDDAASAGSGLGAATMPETRGFSVVLAIHTLWLAARARGLGLGWVSVVDPAHVTRLLEVPRNWRLIALLCIGHPEEPDVRPELERKGWQARLDWRAQVSER